MEVPCKYSDLHNHVAKKTRQRAAKTIEVKKLQLDAVQLVKFQHMKKK